MRIWTGSTYINREIWKPEAKRRLVCQDVRF